MNYNKIVLSISFLFMCASASASMSSKYFKPGVSSEFGQAMLTLTGAGYDADAVKTMSKPSVLTITNITRGEANFYAGVLPSKKNITAFRVKDYFDVRVILRVGKAEKLVSLPVPAGHAKKCWMYMKNAYESQPQ